VTVEKTFAKMRRTSLLSAAPPCNIFGDCISRVTIGMMGSNRQSLIDLLPRAALALAGLVLFAPSSARADCATHLPSLSGFNLPFAEDHVDGRRAAAPSSAPASESPAPKPCSGPLCHKHDPLPYSPMPAPAPVSSGGQEWGCLSRFHLSLFSPHGELLRDDARVHAVRRTADVFHPPRTSSCPI
jgi:hypothetical protein